MNGIDPAGLSLLGTVGGFVGSVAAGIGKAGIAITGLSSLAGSGVYRFYFGGSAVRGGIVGAQIGASLSYAYASGQWKGVAEIAGKGFKSGIYKLIGKAISNWISGTFDEWTHTEIEQDFVEGFAGGVWAATFAKYLNDEGVDDELEEAFASLTLTVTSAFAFDCLTSFLVKNLEQNLSGGSSSTPSLYGLAAAPSTVPLSRLPLRRPCDRF